MSNQVTYVNEDTKSSYYEDAKRWEVLVNRRVLLSGKNKYN